MVSRRHAERSVAIEHLLADGTNRPHVDIEEALLGKQRSAYLFDERAQQLARA